MEPIQIVINGLITILGAIVLFNLSDHLSSGKIMHTYAPTNGPYYWLYILAGQHFTAFLIWMAKQFNLSYGTAVCLFICFVRLIILPLNAIGVKRSRENSEKKKLIQSQIDKIQNIILYQPINSNQRKKLEALKKKCIDSVHIDNRMWPIYTAIAIQIIVAIPLYQAIAYSKTLQNATFIGIDLSKRSLFFGLTASILCFIGILIRVSGMTNVQKKSLGFSSFWEAPLSVLFTGWFFPAIIGLYLLTTELFIVIQSIFEYHVLRIYIVHKYKKPNFSKPETIVTDEVLKNILDNN